MATPIQPAVAAVGLPVHPDFGPVPPLERSLSPLVQGMRGSEILRIAAEVRKLIAQGKPVCNLTVGDFDPRQFPVPAELLQGTRDALEAGETNYPPSDGMLSLREAVAALAARDLGVAYPVESVLIAAGVRPLLYATFRTVLGAGDAVVYGVPSWNTNHYVWLSAARSLPIAARREHGFHPTLDEIAPHLGEARLLCLCSPANPTGTMIDPDELERITIAVVEENRRRAAAGRPFLFLLFDQVYGSLVYGGTHAHPVALVPESAPWVISLDGISKAFAATGLRVGWSYAAPAVTARMRDFLGHVGAWAPRAEQVAAASFLRNRAAVEAFRARMDAGVRARLEALHQGFDALRAEGLPVDCVQPQGAIYLSLQIDLVGRTIDGLPVASNEDIRRLLLEEAGVAAVPFQAFGLAEDTGWFRLSVGAVSLEDIRRAFPRVRDLLARAR
ncbi:MAG TPA: aminotransferase class I/II-fold pyridoxal phosphate-dependent enzyme [Gemmatimonadales bacterium]